jgi:GrpB-like predicted nucleotidyltransferase (UPF0157 family)
MGVTNDIAGKGIHMGDPVEIVDYNPLWAEKFMQLKARVVRTLGESLAVAVEHVGSTAVPGLAAKPVIDIDVVVPSTIEIPAAIEGLTTLGYRHEGEKGINGRVAFHWPPGEERHHLYVCPSDSPELRRHLDFRNFLRAHPEEIRRYADLKRSLAAQFRNDRIAYNEGKGNYVREVLAKVH